MTGTFVTHTLEPHTVEVAIDPEDTEICQISLWCADHHLYVIPMTRKKLENLGSDIASKLKAISAPSERS